MEDDAEPDRASPDDPATSAPHERVAFQIPILDLLPERWRRGEDLWVCAFQMVGVPRDMLESRLTIDLQSALVVMFWGSLPRMAVQARHEPAYDGQPTIAVRTAEGKHGPAPLALVMAPLIGEWTNETIGRARDTCIEATGLLSLHAMSLAEVPLEDYVIRLPEGRLEPTAIQIWSPTALPSLNAALADAFEDLGIALQHHPDSHRLRLALRWLAESKRSTRSDAFLKAWIALEILAMPSGSNIRVINKTLANVYALSTTASAELFLVGRLFSLRSAIVHNGSTPDIPSKVLDYIWALFTDVFFALLGQPAPGLARHKLLSDPQLKSTLLAACSEHPPKSGT